MSEIIEESAERRFGWRPSIPDCRDLKFQVRYMTALPSSVDLRPEMPPVYAQGDLGSCTSQAGGTLWWHTRKKLGLEEIDPARLYLYYNTRTLERSVEYDSGATLRNTLKSMARWGVCPESMHPYDTKQFKKKPSRAAYKTGEKYKATNYYAIPQYLQSLQACLAEGFGVIFGFAVYESLEKDEVKKTGKIPMPQPSERVLGGHAVMLVGYDDNEKHFIGRNSWGSEWGANGYFYAPYDFVLNQAISSDFWTLRSLNG